MKRKPKSKTSKISTQRYHEMCINFLVTSFTCMVLSVQRETPPESAH